MNGFEEVVERHKRTLLRKERLLKPYHEKKKSLEGLATEEHVTMLILEAEIRQIKETLDDLEYLLKSNKY
jgi:hypothetical protein